MNREKAIDFLECKRAYYASLSTDPSPYVKATKICGYTLAESANACLMAIKALEQEPCEDAISRQAVQDLTSELLSDYLYDEDRKKIEDMDAKIGELPSVTPQSKLGHWIPVSERYPNEEDEYKRFYVTDDKDEVSIQKFLISLDKEHHPYFSGMVNVVAWMPLPLPYKAESEEV